MATPAEIKAVKEFKEALINNLGFYLDADMIENFYFEFLEVQMNDYQEEPFITPEIITRVMAV